MLERCKTAQERWGGVHSIIDRWLQDRSQLLVAYCGLKDLKPFGTGTEPPSVKIQTFCQQMIDYLSAGHFEVYEQLLQEAKDFNDGSQQCIDDLYPEIQKTTETCLSFNDRFESKELCLENLTELADELSQLGEVLAERFELEDQLIKKIHNIHASDKETGVSKAAGS
jgi:regulator of sigma D